MACAAALATLDTIDDEGLLARAGDLGRRGLAFLQAIAARHTLVRDARGSRLLLRGRDRRGRRPGSRGESGTGYACLRGGLSFKLGGGNVVTLFSPLTTAEAEFDRAFAILDAALAACGTAG